MSPLPVGIRWLEIASAVTELAIQWWLQSTLVIGSGLIMGLLLRHRGPALQSATYRTTLAVAVTCPLVGALLSAAGLAIPTLALPSIPAVVVEALPAEHLPPPALDSGGHEEPARSIQPNSAATIDADQLPGFARSDDRRAETGLSPWTTHAAPVLPALPSGGKLQSAASDADNARMNSHPPGRRSMWSVRAVPAITVVSVSLAWLLGSAALLARLALDLVRLVRLQRSAAPATEDQQRLCRELAGQMGVRAPELLRTPFVTGPCLSGLRRGAILLPEELPDLPLAAVLVHELAHLRRGDCRWNLIRQASVALLFWQPLAWRLSRRMEEVAEEVCDDHVVHWGGDRTVYASGLVRLAEQRTLPISTVVPLVTFRSLLGQRVQRILDRSHRLSLRAGMKALCTTNA